MFLFREISMQKISARAHSNIALIKYWGKKDVALNIPAVGSVSLALAGLFTETTVLPSDRIKTDTFILNDRPASAGDSKRLSLFLDRVRRLSGKNVFFEVESVNNFPTSAGLASSASGFAALSLAATSAVGLELTPTELSGLARLGSGSAARSIFGGFVEMAVGRNDDGSDAVARMLYPADYWDLSILIAVTSEKQKKTGSTDGMELSRHTSPYYPAWIASSDNDLSEMRGCLAAKDFEKLADLSEYSCLKMHALALASRPGLLYWNGATVSLMHAVRELRQSGIPVFFTVDAGPQVKAICPTPYLSRVKERLENIPGVARTIESALGGAAQLI